MEEGLWGRCYTLCKTIDRQENKVNKNKSKFAV
jgi:hypothetical protein